MCSGGRRGRRSAPRSIASETRTGVGVGEDSAIALARRGGARFARLLRGFERVIETRVPAVFRFEGDLAPLPGAFSSLTLLRGGELVGPGGEATGPRKSSRRAARSSARHRQPRGDLLEFVAPQVRERGSAPATSKRAARRRSACRRATLHRGSSAPRRSAATARLLVEASRADGRWTSRERGQDSTGAREAIRAPRPGPSPRAARGSWPARSGPTAVFDQFDQRVNVVAVSLATGREWRREA